jgi:predicted DNA-binding protein (MmcQ/YjbR family)
MNAEFFRDYCLNKPGVSEGFPFDAKTLVFKVMGKMFALTDIDSFKSVNLKCDPEYAVELRETYHGIDPGYHMSKVHWNTISFVEDVPDHLILELVDHSYALVVKSLTKKLQDELSSR